MPIETAAADEWNRSGTILSDELMLVSQ